MDEKLLLASMKEMMTESLETTKAMITEAMETTKAEIIGTTKTMITEALEPVREDLAEAGLCRCDAGTLTSEGNRGRRCLLLGDGKGNYAFLVLLELDSLGRVRELTITNNPQYDFELMR